MGKRRLPRKEATSGDRLRRFGEQPERFGKPMESAIKNLIVIGASAGGQAALKQVVSGLSQDIPAALIIMLHMSPTSRVPADHFLNVLAEATVVPLVTARSGDRLQRGKIYLTPPGQSVYLQGRTLRLEPQRKDIPASTINRLFESAAHEYQDKVIGVILSGLLRDGTAGLKAVHDAGGLSIVQDPSEAEFPDMPANAMQNLPVTFCLNLAEIGHALDLLARRRTTLETGLDASARMLKERIALLGRLLSQSKGNPGTQEFLSTEIRSLENDMRSIQALLNEAITLAKKADPPAH
jgi:chemotaxis response regulator CheB